MAVVLISGGCNQDLNAVSTFGYGFLNYGAVSSGLDQSVAFGIVLVMPFNGYVSGASVSVNQVQTSAKNFHLYTHATTTNFPPITLPANELSFERTFDDDVITFNAGDRLVWVCDQPVDCNSTVVLTVFELDTILPNPLHCVPGSLIGGFTANQFPFSFGAGAHDTAVTVPNV